MPTPIEVVFTVQYTPDRDPVLLHWCAKSRTGAFAQPQIAPTTQSALIARSGIPGYWGDAEGKAELAAYFEANGILATIVDNPDPQAAQPPEAPQE